MWAQRAWVGRYLPGDTPTGRELQPYSRYVNAVEGNTTFYALPPALTIRKWRELADPGFRFVFKVPRLITHENRLRHSAADLEAFVALLEPLGDLVGGLTLQLPPSFGPRDLDQLDIVLRNAAGYMAAPRLAGTGPSMYDRILIMATTSGLFSFTHSESSSRRPLPRYSRGSGLSRCCTTRCTTVAPAVRSSSPISVMRSANLKTRLRSPIGGDIWTHEWTTSLGESLALKLR